MAESWKLILISYFCYFIVHLRRLQNSLVLGQRSTKLIEELAIDVNCFNVQNFICDLYGGTSFMVDFET